jgi:hypothetical protein
MPLVLDLHHYVPRLINNRYIHSYSSYNIFELVSCFIQRNLLTEKIYRLQVFNKLTQIIAAFVLLIHICAAKVLVLICFVSSMCTDNFCSRDCFCTFENMLILFYFYFTSSVYL